MKQTPTHPDSTETLARTPHMEDLQALTEKKVDLLGRFSHATREINSALDQEEFGRVPISIKKRQDVINRVNILDKKIEQAIFVLRMECLSGSDQEEVEDSLKRIEDIVSLLVADEQECLSRVRAQYDAAKASILDMQAKRKVTQGYQHKGLRVPRFVNSQIG